MSRPIDVSSYPAAQMPSPFGAVKYHVLPDPALSAELQRMAGTTTITGVDCVSFQPSQHPDDRSQDRIGVYEWDLPGGRWKCLCVFDGHGGHETVDHLSQTYPSLLKNLLSSSLANMDKLSSSEVSELLQKSVREFDDSLGRDLLALFPGGPEAIVAMTDEEIRAITHRPDAHEKIVRAQRGSTALIALLDPQREKLWVASLGDCQAVLGERSEDGKIVTSVLSGNHNGRDKSEVERIKQEHPGEPECILRDRVIGSIAVTRAVGDYIFKLPRIYTERIFKNAKTPIRSSFPLDQWLPRNLTPPYLSNRADTCHVDLSPAARTTTDRFLIMASDGLIDLFNPEHEGFSPRIAETWAQAVIDAPTDSNRALTLLRAALGGDASSVSGHMMLGVTDPRYRRWIDDTTILVLPL